MTSPGPSSPRSREELDALARSVGFWWHSIDLGHGVVTPGMKTPQILGAELQSLHLPDLAGRSVLDIGAYDGFYSFEAERRAAKRVVALDHYVWSLDLPAHIAYLQDCARQGVVPIANELTPHWQPETLPGKLGFDTASTALGSRVEAIVGDYMTVDPPSVGVFDVVLYLGVLYHMENPMASLRRLFEFTGELAVIETHAVSVPGLDHLELCEFYPENQLNGDSSNWWGPNVRALTGMCLAAGFSRVEVVSGLADWRRGRGLVGRVREAGSRIRRRLRSEHRLKQPPTHYRLVVHAWR
jgi:tRNA (mo5U34)-methyltransferase